MSCWSHKFVFIGILFCALGLQAKTYEFAEVSNLYVNLQSPLCIIQEAPVEVCTVTIPDEDSAAFVCAKIEGNYDLESEIFHDISDLLACHEKYNSRFILPSVVLYQKGQQVGNVTPLCITVPCGMRMTINSCVGLDGDSSGRVTSWFIVSQASGYIDLKVDGGSVSFFASRGVCFDEFMYLNDAAVCFGGDHFMLSRVHPCEKINVLSFHDADMNLYHNYFAMYAGREPYLEKHSSFISVEPNLRALFGDRVDAESWMLSHIPGLASGIKYFPDISQQHYFVCRILVRAMEWHENDHSLDDLGSEVVHTPKSIRCDTDLSVARRLELGDLMMRNVLEVVALMAQQGVCTVYVGELLQVVRRYSERYWQASENRLVVLADLYKEMQNKKLLFMERD